MNISLGNIAEVVRNLVTVLAVVSAVFVAAGSFLWNYVLRDEIEPILEVPEKVARLESTNELILEAIEPLAVLEFKGDGRIIRFTQDVETRQWTMTVNYFLRRNVSCDTMVFPYFFNLDTQTMYPGESFLAIKSPVQENFAFFNVPVLVPTNLTPGRYTYLAKLSPIDCPDYPEIFSVPTEIFTIPVSPIPNPRTPL